MANVSIISAIQHVPDKNEAVNLHVSVHDYLGVHFRRDGRCEELLGPRRMQVLPRFCGSRKYRNTLRLA